MANYTQDELKTMKKMQDPVTGQLFDLPTPPSSAIGIMTSDNAISMVNKDKEGILALPSEGATRIMAGQNQIFKNGNWTIAPAPTTTTPKTELSDNSVSYINENGQTQTRDASSMTPQELRDLINQGFHIENVGKGVPSWISQNNPDLGETVLKNNVAEKEFNDTKSALLASTTATADQATLNAIAALYDARKNEMARINERREASLSTLGIRIGATRYGGGVFGGIIAEEERAGIARITALEAEKQQAIAQANEAARTQKWTQFSKFVDLAEKRYSDTQEALKELNKTAIEQNKKLNEQTIRSSRDDVIANLILQGVDDPLQIINFLNYDENGISTGGNFTAKEIGDVLNIFEKEKQKPISYDDLRKINNSVEGLNLPFGTTEGDLINLGIVPSGKTAGDYNYQTVKGTLLRIDKETGEQKVVYQAPETDDPFTLAQRFTNAFNMAKEVQNSSTDFIKVRDARNRINASASDPSAAGDLALIFNYMKILDPGSTVREGEFANAQSAGSVPERIWAQYNRIIQGTRLTDTQRKDFVKRSEELYGSQLESQVLYQAQQVDFAESFGLDPAFAVPDFTNLRKQLSDQLRSGEIIVWDIQNKQAGAIPVEEFDSSKYVRF